MSHSLLALIIAIIFPVVILLATTLLSSRSFMDREKSSAFECGFDPKSSARIPFSLRFFLLAVIFLVFDIEIALLMPLPLTLDLLPLISTISGALLFLIILMLGLLHEWNEGSLDWTE
uniref:NADH dehydrogenase subunit 3 n=1 Tax=Leocrates chinensis TaxID=378359 RepID=UPI0021D5279D|nr:NADH dehydrogenase subunit 3 [Leocrates chinensis]UXC96454.1 NADH dehydrogenase subunit 3 [Leocrates chinensis]